MLPEDGHGERGEPPDDWPSQGSIIFNKVTASHRYAVPLGCRSLNTPLTRTARLQRRFVIFLSISDPARRLAYVAAPGGRFAFFFTRNTF